MIHDRHYIERVKSANPIEEVIGAEIELTKRGSEYKALCPFHQEKSPSFYVKPDKDFFHCFSGDTVVPTRNGRSPIGSLSGHSHELVMPDGTFRRVPILSFGKQRLWAMEMHRNGVERIIYTTSDHGWFVRGCKAPLPTRRLRPDHRLLSVNLPLRRNWTLEGRSIQHGIVFGDGTLQKKFYGTVILHGEKMDLTSWFEPSTAHAKKPVGASPYVRIYGGRSFEKFKTTPALQSTDGYLLGFIAGWLATDGCVDDRGAVILTSSDRNALAWARDAALRCGLETTAIGEQIRKGYLEEPGSHYRIEFRRSTFDAAMLLRKSHRGRYLRGTAPAFERKRWVVERVFETARKSEVFCAQVPRFHAFALDDDLLTSNCFGCGAHGDVIKWVMERQGITFRQALETLAQRACITF